MTQPTDSPRIYIPPPVIYIGFFLVAILLQGATHMNNRFFLTVTSKVLGALLIVFGLFFNFPALRQFFKTKNTVVTSKPANSLQTTGIYSVSRNPMYISLLLFYTGLSFLIGNWWHIILLPVLFLIVQEYIIKREERYLLRRFGEQYLRYTTKVRRWI